MNVLHRHSLTALALAVMIPSMTFAQPAPSSKYTSFDATPEKPVQMGYYASAHKSVAPHRCPKSASCKLRNQDW